MRDGLDVAVRGLAVRFPRATRAVPHGVDLAVAPGERLLVMGPSGSGKSTLLRVLAGIVPQTIDADVTGRVTVAGHDATATPVPILAGSVGTLTQNPADQLCLPNVTDELAFALENRQVPPDRIAARVEHTLANVGARHLGDRSTATLSGGEGQRVALAAALVPDPDVLLLDEPTALLDPAGVAEVGHAIGAAGSPARSHGRGRRTLVLVEHRLDELPWLPERVLVLGAGGSVDVDGPTDEVLHSQGRRLLAEGAWLPLEAELHAATGHTGGPADPDVARALSRMAAPSRVPSAHGDVVLRASSAQVRRGDRVVVRDADLRLRRGQITAVMGPNGSGKTTLLLGLAGLLPASGVDGGSVGMVFQNPEHQFLARTVREEIAYGVQGADAPSGRNRRAISARGGMRGDLEEVLDRFHLRDVADADPFRLSGGQQRRLSLAAMVVLDRDVLLADEPTFGQDRRTSQAVAGALTELARAGHAVVIATHDLRLAARIADQVVVMSEGRVLAAGDTAATFGRSHAVSEAGLRLPGLLRWWRTSDLPLRGLLEGIERASP